MRRTPAMVSLSLCAAALAAVPNLAAHAAQAAHAAPSSHASVPSNLEQIQVRTSLLGTHTSYQQTYRGVEVLGGFYAVHDLRDGLRVADGRVAVTGLESVSAKIDRAAAKTAAAAGHGAASSITLAIQPGATAKLVWKVETATGKQVLVDAVSGKVVKVTDEREYADGTGQVFDPNPVVKLQNESLTDGSDADSAVPSTAYTSVTLHHLSGNGYLQGTYAYVTGKGKYARTLAYSATNTFSYTRNADEFEQVNAYFAVDQLQSYIQGLGFTNVNSEAQDLLVDQSTADNSWYSPSADTITLGTGGVDDGEDQEVIWHEYGHAVQDDQVPGFGSTEEGGAIGEGFGDYLAMTMSQANSSDTTTTPWACVMDWDSVSYTSTTPHCIRRLDTDKTVADKTGEVHDDGEIWSRALYDINKNLGRDKANRIILEAQFGYAPSTNFAQAAQVTVDTAASLYDSTTAATVRAAFQARGIL
ncbi:MAG TPA: M36 family metallopeptidase [Nocardioides sp.]